MPNVRGGSRDPAGGYGGRDPAGGRSGLGGSSTGTGSGLRDIFGGALRGASFGAGVGGLPGAVVGGGIGGLIGGIRSGGFGGLGGFGGGTAGPMGGRGDRGRGGRDLTPPGILGAGPLAGALKRYARPDPGKVPAWMRFDPVMTDLQRRSYIATEGVSGNQGLFRSQEAKDYYKNLLGRMFISPLGQPQGDLGHLLPIEHQYLQALGMPQFQDIPTLLTGLGYQPG